MREKKGYLQVYTGDGKGKTTAAIGLAVRAALAGKRVFVGQFVKSMRYHECRLEAGVHVCPGARLAGCVRVGRYATGGSARSSWDTGHASSIRIWRRGGGGSSRSTISWVIELAHSGRTMSL